MKKPISRVGGAYGNMPGLHPPDDKLDEHRLHYIAEIEEGVWLCDVEGDPGRTLVKESAMKFTSLEDAIEAVKAAREAFTPFPNARVECLLG